MSPRNVREWFGLFYSIIFGTLIKKYLIIMLGIIIIYSICSYLVL